MVEITANPSANMYIKGGKNSLKFNSALTIWNVVENSWSGAKLNLKDNEHNMSKLAISK